MDSSRITKNITITIKCAVYIQALQKSKFNLESLKWQESMMTHVKCWVNQQSTHGLLTWHSIQMCVQCWVQLSAPHKELAYISPYSSKYRVLIIHANTTNPKFHEFSNKFIPFEWSVTYIYTCEPAFWIIKHSSSWKVWKGNTRGTLYKGTYQDEHLRNQKNLKIAGCHSETKVGIQI